MIYEQESVIEAVELEKGGRICLRTSDGDFRGMHRKDLFRNADFLKLLHRGRLCTMYSSQPVQGRIYEVAIYIEPGEGEEIKSRPSEWMSTGQNYGWIDIWHMGYDFPPD